MIDLSQATPAELRSMIRNNELIKPTAGMANGYAQANLAILKKSMLLISYYFVSVTLNPVHCWMLRKLVQPFPHLQQSLGIFAPIFRNIGYINMEN